MSSIFPQWLQDLNTALGMVGFVITVVVMFQVSAIKRSFKSRARLPEIVKDLEQAGSALNATLAAWPAQKNNARSHIKVAASLLQAAVRLLPREEQTPIKSLEKRISNAAKDFNCIRFDNPNEAWDIYSDIQSSITHLNQSVRSLNWS